jgi:DNA repair protein RecO (recombination protein O)
VPRILTEAIPLRTVRYSETSQIVSLLTPEIGTTRAIAKGAFRRKGGALDPLRIYRTAILAKRSGALATLTDWECRHPLAGLRRDFDRLLAGCYKAEIAGYLTPEGLEAGEIYGVVRESLRHLDGGGDPAVNTLVFSVRMLSLSGFQPSLEGCGRCRRPVPLRGDVIYGEGTLVCRRCGVGQAATYPGAALALVASLSSRGGAEGVEDARFPRHLVIQAQQFLDDRFREMTERELRTMRYWVRWGTALPSRGKDRGS